MTMRLIKKVYYTGDDYCGVYKCDKCHAYIIDQKMLSNKNDDVEAYERKCALCWANTPLSQQYWTALCTVTYACKQNGLGVKTAPLFPSFYRVNSDDKNIYSLSLRFPYQGREIRATTYGIGPYRDQFFSMLDDDYGDFDPRFLAQAVVDLCRHDLWARNNRKEAE